MKTHSMIWALVLGLALLATTPAFAQHVKVFDGTTYTFYVPAAPNQEVRVTVVNPKLIDSENTSAAHVDYFLKLQGLDGDISSHTIAPGASYTFTLDPRTTGQVIDPKTGLRGVDVSFHIKAEVVEGRCASKPAITVELVNVRTRESQIVQAFPGFVGGVYVAAGDVN